MKFFKRAKRGFTLVELVVVIAVIAILAAVSVGAYFGITDSANNSRLEQEAKAVHTNIQLVASANDSNSSLGKNGLYVYDINTFKSKLYASAGIDYTVTNDRDDLSTISGPTIYLSTAGLPNSLIEGEGPQTYKTFEYLTNQVAGKKIIVDVVSGKTKITTATFEPGDSPADPDTSTSTPVAPGTSEPITDGSTIAPTETPTTPPTSEQPIEPEQPEQAQSLDVVFEGNSITSISMYDDDVKTISVVDVVPANSLYSYTVTDDNDAFDFDFETGTIVGKGEGEGSIRFYSELFSKTITVSVTAVEATGLSVNNFTHREYFVGDSINLENVTYSLTYNKEGMEPKVVSADDVTVSHSVFNESGDVIVVFTYNGEEGQFTNTIQVTVTPISIVSFEASVATIEGTYYAGDTFDSGITFDVTYNNGDEETDLTLNDVSYDPNLVAGQTSMTFSYPKESENPKIITIKFASPVIAVELDRISVTNLGTAKTTYEVGETPSKDGLAFTAYYNNGDERLIENLELITIVTQEITADTEYITYSYTEGEITKTVNLDITVTLTKTYYFLDQDWWSGHNISPWFKIYDSNENALRVDGKGVQMELIEGSYFGLTDNQFWSIQLDMNDAEYIQIFRCFNITEEDDNFADAKTELFKVSDMSDKNLIILSKNAAWNNEENQWKEAEVSFDNYKEGDLRDVHILGLGDNGDNDWIVSDSNKLTYNLETKKYTISNINLKYNDTFKFYVSNFGEKYIDYTDISSKLGNGFASDNTSNDNIRIRLKTAGVYDLEISLDGTITFTKNSDNITFAIYGLIKGVNKWKTPINQTSRTNNVVYFNGIELNCGDEFLIGAIGYDFNNIKYSFNNIENQTGDFIENDTNIYLVKCNGKYNISLNLENDKITITSVSNTKRIYYLNPKVGNDTWDKDNARFSAYFCNGTSSAKWENMHGITIDGTKYYYVEIPDGNYKDIIFCRMNGSTTTNNWNNNLWNQTVDVALNGATSKNLYSLTKLWDGKATGNWAVL